MQEFLDFLVLHDKLATALTAIAALFISTVSILLTVINLWMQRTHNRKSVHPIGHISVGDYENEIFVRLRNDGVGPLIVDTVSVSSNEIAYSKDSLIEFMPMLPGNYPWATFVRDLKGRAISAGDQITLLKLNGDPGAKDFESSKTIVRKILSNLIVQIQSRDIYGKNLPVITRPLTWFARHI